MLAPSDPYTIIDAGNLGVFRSTDAGQTWTDITGTLPVPDGVDEPGTPSALAVARRDPARMYIALREGALFRTTDGGATWTESSPTGASDFSAIELTDDLGEEVTVVGRVGGGVWSSTDGGDSWTAQMPMQPAPGAIISLARTEDTVWVGLEATIDFGGGPGVPGDVYGGVYTSTSGAHWKAVLRGIDPSRVAGDIIVAPYVNDVLELSVGTNDAMLALVGSRLYALDGGGNWTPVDTKGVPTVAAFDSFGNERACDRRLQDGASLARDPDVPDHLYLGSYSFGVYERAPGAEVWTQLP